MIINNDSNIKISNNNGDDNNNNYVIIKRIRNAKIIKLFVVALNVTEELAKKNYFLTKISKLNILLKIETANKYSLTG